MHITLEADYAVRIVQCLAKAQGRIDAKKIAEETGVTLRFSLKILGKLVAGELVRSFKGTKGGYELARPAADISMADAIAAVEGRYALSRCCCEAKDYQCSHNDSCDCKFHHVFSEISQLVQDKLDAVKFSQLV